MKLTIKHYYDFGRSRHPEHLDNAQSWDHLRLDEKDADNIFSIPASRQQWQDKCLTRGAWQGHAQAIGRLLQSGFRRVNSYGVGAAELECCLKHQYPSVFLQCSDYTPESLQRLREVFPEADEIICFDMFKDTWVDGNACLHLFYRIDTIFDDAQWRAVFARTHAAGIQHILFVPCEFLTWRRLIRQKIKYALYYLLKKPLAFAGYIRTREQLLALFAPYYRLEQSVPVGALTGFLLTHNKAGVQ